MPAVAATRLAYDRQMKLLIGAVVALLAFSACTSLPGSTPRTSLPTIPASPTVPPDDVTTPPDLTIPPDMTIPPELGDVPVEIYRQAAEQAAAAAGATLDDVTIVRAERVTWNDGSLGCPEPGQMYTQALVPGFWLVLRAGDQQFDFRASERGELKLCPVGQGQPPIEDQ